MAKALVVCSTMSGETKQIGESITDGLLFSGVEATVIEADCINVSKDLEGYDALVVGSASYHVDKLSNIKNLLHIAENAELKGKIGGAFGAPGWSDETPDQIIFDTMNKVLKMEMVSSPLNIGSQSLSGMIKKAQSYGREIAKKLTA